MSCFSLLLASAVIINGAYILAEHFFIVPILTMKNVLKIQWSSIKQLNNTFEDVVQLTAEQLEKAQATLKAQGYFQIKDLNFSEEQLQNIQKHLDLRIDASLFRVKIACLVQALLVLGVLCIMCTRSRNCSMPIENLTYTNSTGAICKTQIS